MKKKILAIVLCIAMLAIAIVGGTMAYFTDEKEATNTFTVGSVEIELLESKLHRTNDNATDADIEADAATYQSAYLAVEGKDIVPGRWVLKAPYVKNTGDNAAYVRVRLLLPHGVSDYLHVMQTTTAREDGSLTRVFGTYTDDNGNTCDMAVFTYTEALEPSEMTYWPAFWQFKLDENCTSEQIAELITQGLLTEDGQFNIKVEADAIQAEGFDDAAAAFAAFDAQ